MSFKIIRGDCLHKLANLPDASIDAFVTDPPYGIDLCLRTNPTRPVVIGDGRDEARRLWADFLPHAARLAKPHTAHVFFGTWKSIWIAELLARHFTIKGCVVWRKNTWGLGWHLRPQWELFWLCHKGRVPKPIKAEPDVWDCRRDHRLLHPCQKPVELLRRCIRLVLPDPRMRRRAMICDPFAGIASTALAAVQEGVRNFLAIERDPRYARLGRQRLAAILPRFACDTRAARGSSMPAQTLIESP